MNRITTTGVILLTAAIMLFVGQNYQTSAEITFIAWTFETSVAMTALVPLLVGLLVGAGSAIVARYRGGRRARQRMEGKEEIAEPEAAGIPPEAELEGAGDEPDELLEERSEGKQVR